MNDYRRSLLKGIISGGGLLSMPSLALINHQTPIQDALPTLVLSSSKETEQAFVSGVKQGMPWRLVETQQCDLSSEFFIGFENILRENNRQRIMGLLDDANAALVLQLARSAGAQVNWIGEHHVESGHSRHDLLATSYNQSCLIQYGIQLKQAGYELTDIQSIANTSNLFELSLSRPSGSGWAESLGYAMVNPASNRTGILSESSDFPLQGHYVSFLIEV